MKKLVIMIMLIAAAIPAAAKSLVVVLDDGTEVYYQIGGEKDPVMTRTQGTVTVNADTYEMSAFSRFYISSADAPSAVGDAKAAKTRFDGGTLYVTTADKPVAVYRPDGSKVRVRQSHGDGWTALSLEPLRSGTYIVRVGESSLKIRKQ